jgi:hypothetical protein
MYRSSSKLLVTLAVAFSAACLSAQTADTKQAPAPAKKAKAPPLPGAGTGGNTPHATTSEVIGPNRANGSRVTVTYGRPFLKHPRTGEVRKVWGGLVPWDKANRLGADEATTLIAQHDLEIAGTKVPAGAYTLYIVPSESGTSKLAFSKKIGDWGVPVDEKNDLARFELKKETIPATVEQLTIAIVNGPPESLTGTIRISWETTQFSLPFAVKK